MSAETTTGRVLDPEAAGVLRQQLRADGWRADLRWLAVGAGNAATMTGETRRTVAYLPSLAQIDGGASRIWCEGDVPAPASADAREVFVTTAGDPEWHSESLEAPPETVIGIDAHEAGGGGAPKTIDQLACGPASTLRTGL